MITLIETPSAIAIRGTRNYFLEATGQDGTSSRYREASAPVDLIHGEKDWSRPSDRGANRQLLPTAQFIQIPNAGHFIALERPDVPANLLNRYA